MANPKRDGKQDPRYADWYAAYVEDVRDRVKHWGDKRSSAVKGGRADSAVTRNPTTLDGSLFESGR